MASFPTSIVSPTDPTAANTLNSPDHAGEHQSHNAEIVALETKMGTGSSTPAANKLLYATGTGTSAWQGLTSAQLIALLSDETGSGSAVFGTAPTISSPVVTTGTFASPVLTTPAVVTSINDANGNEVIKTPASASAVNEITITNAATATDPSIAPTGNDSAINLNLRGKGLAKSVTIGAGAALIYPYDFVYSGCVITADAAGSTLNWSMTAGVVVINGNPVTVAALSAQAATASRDTYVDVLDAGDGTGTVVRTGGNIVTNNAASPALASNSIRIGIIVSGAGNIAAAASINQGQEDRVLPIASSIPYTVTDSLGNLICSRDSVRKTLGYRQIISPFSSATIAGVDVTGLSVPFLALGNRKVKVSAFTPTMLKTGSAGDLVNLAISEGATRLTITQFNMAGSNFGTSLNPTTIITPSAGLHTYKVVISATGAGTMQVAGTSTSPSYILVEPA